MHVAMATQGSRQAFYIDEYVYIASMSVCRLNMVYRRLSKSAAEKRILVYCELSINL